MAEKPKEEISTGPRLAVWTITALTLLVPLVVLPKGIDNAFKTPKFVLLLTGAAVLAAVHGVGLFRGRKVTVAGSATPAWILVLAGLNTFSLLYTHNPYHTKIAFLMNTSCLLILYMVSVHLESKGFQRLAAVTVGAGVTVGLVVCLQFHHVFLIFSWASGKAPIMGTIGNSNYLGAYLLFPAYAAAGMLILTRGFKRAVAGSAFVFLLGALLASRARASWLGFVLAFPVFLCLIKSVSGFPTSFAIKKHWKSIALYGILALLVGGGPWLSASQGVRARIEPESVARTETLGYRAKYFRASWWLFKQSPLFGTGLWSFRNRVYHAQAEIQRKDPTYFKDYVEPKPRRVHNDYLEILNDGGLVSAVALVGLFLTVMIHGYRVIKDPKVPVEERVLSAAAFTAVVSAMMAALFFFPFRITPTLFMFSVMLGLLEALYLRNRGLASWTEGKRVPGAGVAICLLVLVLMGVLWFGAVKPFRAEIAHYRYKVALAEGRKSRAETEILKALRMDPQNTAYALYAGQFYLKTVRNYVRASRYLQRAMFYFNGDVTGWGVQYLYGVVKFKMGSLFEARDAFRKALYYNPNFDPARKKLNEVQQVLRKHDRIMIKYR